MGFDGLTEGGRRLQGWAEALVGRAVAPLHDISGGAWRALRPSGETPPSNAGQERLKFLLHTADGAWLLRFAGLGRIGSQKLELARTLHGAGRAPEPAGLTHGFLVERWIEPAPRPPGLPPLADYLLLRSGLEAPPDAGAPLAALLDMARVNMAEAGLETGLLERFEVDRLQARVRRTRTDNRLHRWEWVPTADGRWLKADAVDHHAAHDLIGCQDIAWDVAGAETEWDLDPDESDQLCAAVGADPELLSLLRPCYLAFQLGYYAMAADAHAGWAEEAARLRGRSGLYRARLQALVETL